MGNKQNKVKAKKVYTRQQALRAMNNKTVHPSQFLDMDNAYRYPDPKNPDAKTSHANYHVRARAWVLLGCPLPSDPAEKAKFLASIHVKEKTEAVEEQPSDVSEEKPSE